MLSTLRVRILLAALVAITLALVINGIASYTTVKHHNSQQVNRNLEAVVRGNTQALNEWMASRVTMLSALEQATLEDNPLPALQQLTASGGFMASYMAYPDTPNAVFSDGWEPPSDYDPRQRPWYQDAVNAETTVVTAPYVDMISNELVVSFVHPYYQEGELVAVVGADININDVVKIVASIAPTPSSFGFLTTGDGTLVAHPDSSLSLEPSTALSSELDSSRLAQITSAEEPQAMALQGSNKLLLGQSVGGNSDWQLLVALDETEATAGLRAIATTSIVTLLIVAAITAVVFGLLLSLLLRRLLVARDAMDDIASGEGDLTRRLPEEGNDEITQIAKAFNRFVGTMEAVLVDVRTSSESVHHAANEIAMGGQDLSRRTDNAAASLQQTSASIEEITSTVQHTSASAQEANKLSQTASEVANEGGKVVANVVTTMEDISRASGKIGEIVTLMNSISFQTNLLALNASVEAARAGEHGRGFAVVADEVRKLAGRSSEAANDIQKLIEDSQTKVNNGTTLVRNAGATMQDIVAHITRVTDVLEEINAATSEQSDGINQVNIAVAELDRMTQENAAMVEESTTAAEQLKEQADHLAGTISSFKLSQHPPAPLTSKSAKALPSF
ncbi:MULTISPECIES: methyl-accepting chemotaxis protein [unclassified Halomonas]|uniref:methyl-accepting chemotaxis protein n=1 Tax=unclassified Halomonas TaxID=2609666 RepID=UPI0007DA3F11|nr:MULTISPECIES: methyl-accepting chemotaxis protein [unclassified Halomonas]MBT2786572.1 HAMP domain-containing protein [Halomonas sp. ISL-106]MBT2797594.1 HAMP domain-containing protein [Halomonas sp. ISL-104]OAL58942.1 chemotaxis protein [Halomonas sp. ALS9]